MFDFLKRLFTVKKISKIQRTILDLESIDPEVFKKVYSSDWGTYYLTFRYHSISTLTKGLDSFCETLENKIPLQDHFLTGELSERKLQDIFLSSTRMYGQPVILFEDFRNSAVRFLKMYEEVDNYVLDESDRPRSMIVLRTVVQELIAISEHLVNFHRVTEKRMLGIYS